MSTAEIARPGTAARAPTERTGEAAASDSLAGIALVGALILLLLYAAFDHGAASAAAGARLQVAVAAIATAAAAVWLWTGTFRFHAPRLAIAGLASLGLFVIWSGVSLAWSVAPNQTWIELNRDLTYLVVLVLALIAGASSPRSVGLIGRGALLVVFVVTLYALGQKLAPGVHLPGVFNLNQTQAVPRLQEPFGYWNALALFIAFGVPIALALAVDSARRPRARLIALMATEVMLLTLVLTYSRGGLLALACGLVVMIWLSGARLRSLMWLAVACIATVPPLVFALTSHRLTTPGISLSARASVGGVLFVVLLVSLAALWFGGSRLLKLEQRTTLEPEQRRRIVNALGGAVGVVIVCAVIAVAVSSRGLGGTVSHAWDSFTSTKATTDYAPARLLSADSENRWGWWKEAAGAFSARPLEGWGAGSFPVVHLLYRQNTISVQEPHSVPLQFLSDTGIVGALLGLAAYALLLAAAARTVRRRSGSELLFSAALLAVLVLYGVHALYDWDWDIPGVTLPALVVAGVLAGAAGRRQSAAVPVRRSSVTAVASGRGVRAVAVAMITATLAVFAFSGVVPSVAATRASSALVTASAGTSSALKRALSTAQSATRLDPLSDAGLLTSSTIAIRRGQIDQSRVDLVAAVTRDPTDAQAWGALVLTEIRLGDTLAAGEAAERDAALDPMGGNTRELLQIIDYLDAPPTDSATAVRTPLPAPGS